MPGRRLDEPGRPVDHAAATDLNETDGAGARGRAVRGLEVDGGEVQRHGPDRRTGFRHHPVVPSALRLVTLVAGADAT
ncbi:hypothetical protein Cus16_1156 [Curtobacterium sp. ER1/6]|nr:hypothetical protein Cus16_1156 [Curtobacterium sp. ER1/6]